jgi:MYXO-CTERM domain-containing protein
VFRRLLALTVVTAFLVVPPAQAHGPFDPRVRVLVDGLSPASEDVRVIASFDVQGLPPRMTARNDGAAELEILAIGGEPLFRIGQDGAFGNVRSDSYRNAVDPFHVLPAPTPKPGTGPDWRKMTYEPAWRWYEDRAAFHGRVPPSIAATAGPVDLGSWRVAARLGGRPVSIKGRVVWKVPQGSIRARVLPARWASKGISVTALQGPTPGLQVQNTTSTVLEVTGRDEMPFARISAAGVDVNTQSITWADSKGIPEPSGDGPSWRHETDLPALIWVENRAGYEQPEPPASVERAMREQVLVRWEVPARLGDKPVLIKGETFWRPAGTAGKDSSPPYVPIGAALGAAGVAVIALRRRRSSQKPAE